MKTLCITGFAHPALNTIAQHIFNSGLSTARASQQNESMDIEAWHQRVIAKHGDTAPVAKIGRLWEQLAADIFLNNLHTPAWGWTSPQSLALLDFWQQFDPQVYFVLVCVSPQQALTQAIADPSSDMAPAKVLEDWYTTHQTMLRFHLRHPERCMLIMAEDALSAPNQLIENLVSQWALPLQAAATSVHSPATDTSSAEVIAKHLAQQLLTDSSTENSLYQEILACITPLAQETLSASDTLSCEAVINAYRQLCDRSKEMHALEQAQAELSTTRSALQQQIHALHQAQDEQGKLSAKQAEQLKALEHTHAQLTTELADAKEESELLLTQLHQVQEELEGTFLKQQQTTQQLAAAKASLDAIGQEKNQLLAARDALNKQIAELTKARDEQTRIAAERKAQLDALTKDKGALHAELTDAREEGDLLLNQLHQVQEELEHYFLQHQQTKQSNETLEKRLRRVHLRMPHYSYYGNLQISVPKDSTAIDWHFEDLEIAGRVFAKLQCSTQFLNGGALIRFMPSPSHPFAFLRSSATDTTVDLVVGPKGIGPVTMLDALGTSDIAFLFSMAHLFTHVLQSTASKQLPAGFPAEPLRQALAQLPLQLQALPPRLRFDQVQLKADHAVPGYEHLWLVVEQLSFGTQQWEQFEFRVACANTEAAFGTDPKLEFPQPTGASPLTGWFAESNDEHGDKLELRFAQPDAMDLSVWSQLTAQDHDFVRALMGRIPAMLAALQIADVSIHRNWQDWSQLTQDMQRILDLRAPAANTPVADAPVADERVNSTSSAKARDLGIHFA